MSGILKRLFSKKNKTNKTNKTKTNKKSVDSTEIKPRILKRDQHCVSRKDISKNAVKVLYKLNEAGYQAYLVGGGVRDILLGLKPKDFDVATDATPEEIQALFRNCRLIGRRFRLAHILYGREVIEVATFRAGHDLATVEQAKKTQSPFKGGRKASTKDDLARTSDHGMLTRDNVYGSMIDDAFRRDFTVNALYYTVKDFSVIDYTEGLKDLENKQLRLIGDPTDRYREDPVRILRAIRLSCKLGLSIEQKTAEPIQDLANLLLHVSSARLWEECNKMLLAGFAEKTWKDLCQRNVATYLFEQTIKSLKQQKDNQFSDFINAALQSTDKRIANHQPVTPAFLFAVFLWQPLQDYSDQLIEKGVPPYEAHQKAATKVMEIQRDTIAMPKRFSMVAKEMWSLQFRLFNLRKKSVYSLLAHPRFRAAYDFLCLRAGNDEKLIELAKWWTDFQSADEPQRLKMLMAIEHPKRKKRNYSTKKKK